jgi:hypothetical protein
LSLSDSETSGILCLYLSISRPSFDMETLYTICF